MDGPGDRAEAEKQSASHFWGAQSDPTCFCGIRRLELFAGVHLSAAELGKLLREQRINLDYMSCGPQWCP